MQLISLGAGFCSRAWRLSVPVPYQHIFELDRAQVLLEKLSLMTALSRRLPVSNLVLGEKYSALGVDLQLPFSEALLQAEYQAHIPTVWVLEGLLYYLPETSVRSLLTEAHRISAKGSTLLATVVNWRAVYRAQKSNKGAKSAFQSGIYHRSKHN